MTMLDVKRWPDDPHARAALGRMIEARSGHDPYQPLAGDVAQAQALSGPPWEL